MTTTTATVDNLGEVLRALKTVERDIRLGVRKEIREAAEPIRRDAQDATLESVRNMPASPRWAGMKVGVTQRAVYVAPRARSTRAVRRKRPNLADLMMTRAMEPTLRRHQDRVVDDVRGVLDRAAARFNRS